MILKKILFLIFSLNLVFPATPLYAHKDKNEFDNGFFLGAHGTICAIYLLGDLNEIQAKKYISFNRSYTLQNKDLNNEVKNFAENYRFSRGNEKCNRLID